MSLLNYFSLFTFLTRVGQVRIWVPFSICERRARAPRSKHHTPTGTTAPVRQLPEAKTTNHTIFKFNSPVHLVLLGPNGFMARSDPPVVPSGPLGLALDPPVVPSSPAGVSWIPRVSSGLFGVSWILQ